MRQLPADVARCQNKLCSKKDTCLRYLSPPHERQVYMYRQDEDGCEDYIEISNTESEGRN